MGGQKRDKEEGGLIKDTTSAKAYIRAICCCRFGCVMFWFCVLLVLGLFAVLRIILRLKLSLVKVTVKPSIGGHSACSSLSQDSTHAGRQSRKREGINNDSSHIIQDAHSLAK